MSHRLATLTGFGAVLLWALLALLTDASGDVPPFQLSAISFAIAGAAGLLVTLARPGGSARLIQPLPVFALGVGGLFGYHFLYFSALRNAPAVEASLIAYLWPLLIVLRSTRVTGERLKPHHLIGALLGFAGAALLVTRDTGLGFDVTYTKGYALALAAAFVWSSYSILSRRVAHVPTEAVTGFCIATALLAALCHVLFESTIWPATATEWLAVLGLGLGPVGLAFFLWDIGVKHGDISALGAASYAAPLLSTLILIAAGAAVFSWSIAIACLLITLGAVIASRSLLTRR